MKRNIELLFRYFPSEFDYYQTNTNSMTLPRGRNRGVCVHFFTEFVTKRKNRSISDSLLFSSRLRGFSSKTHNEKKSNERTAMSSFLLVILVIFFFTRSMAVSPLQMSVCIVFVLLLFPLICSGDARLLNDEKSVIHSRLNNIDQLRNFYQKYHRTDQLKSPENNLVRNSLIPFFDVFIASVQVLCIARSLIDWIEFDESKDIHARSE